MFILGKLQGWERVTNCTSQEASCMWWLRKGQMLVQSGQAGRLKTDGACLPDEWCSQAFSLARPSLLVLVLGNNNVL